jgi:hypothetical protein
MRTDWSPFDAPREPYQPPPTVIRPRPLTVSRVSGRGLASGNGRPEHVPYRHDPAGHAREAEVAAVLAAIRAQAARRASQQQEETPWR